MTDPVQDRFDLERFLDAQARVITQVLSELRAGQKRTHWMWFIFPQLAGLGSSPMAQRYAISGRKEAEAYLAHPILGARLKQCTQIVNAISTRTIQEIFGYPDDLKFRSSITLFSVIEPEEELFRTALRKYFAGNPDSATLALLK